MKQLKIVEKLNRRLLVVTMALLLGQNVYAQLSGIYYIGTGQTYTTITAARNDLASLGVNGPVVFYLTNTLYNTASGETFPITFNAITGASVVNTITIVPFGSTTRIESSNATTTIDLNGVSNLIIDGSPGGAGGFLLGNNLVVANTNTSAPAIRFINEASRNKILYTDLQANNTKATVTAGAGVISFGTTTGANGNDSNTIQYCDIHNITGGNPTICLSSIGSATTTATNNDGNNINNCNIYDFYSATIATAGVYIGANNGGWILNNNRCYQSATRSYTAAVRHRGFWIDAASTNVTSASGFVISGNYFGGDGLTGSYTTTGTTHTFYMMEVFVGIGTPTIIQNNVVTKINASGGVAFSFVGMNLERGTANIMGNVIGDTTTNSQINYTALTATAGFIGIRIGNTASVVNLKNNRVSGIDLNASTSSNQAEFIGLNLFGGTTVVADGNIVGSATISNSINSLAPSNLSTTRIRMAGIYLNTSVTNCVYTVSNNTVANINCSYMATGTQLTTLSGIFIGPTGAGSQFKVANNSIYNLTTATQTTGAGAGSALVGINVGSTIGKINIVQNDIRALTLTGLSTTAAVLNTGIYFSSATTDTNLVNSNLIQDLSLSVNNPNAIVSGIDIGLGNGIVSNNMVRLGTDALSNYVTTACTMRGINKSTGSNKIYFNTVRVEGFGVNSDLNRTYAFIRTGAGTDDVRNNIFINTRNNGGNGGGQLAVSLNNATALTQNNNILRADSIGVINGVGAQYFVDWQLVSTVDVNSKDTIVNFVSPTDLHLASNMYGVKTFSGVPIIGITTDFDNGIRNTVAPYIGADEILSHPLPVKLVSFSAVKIADDVELNWTTASEQNNRGFDIERSVDGKTFGYVNFVKGAGSGNNVLRYNLTDADAFAKVRSDVLYYRLKQQDNDGEYVYSGIVKVERKAEKLKDMVSVSPNPFTANYWINVKTNEAGTSTIEMSDIQGRIVMTKSVTVLEGANTIDVNNLPVLQSGVYFVKVTTHNEIRVIKLIKE